MRPIGTEHLIISQNQTAMIENAMEISANTNFMEAFYSKKVPQIKLLGTETFFFLGGGQVN
jgi:hypothetical protein